jgi:hypothetical protein
MYITDLLLCNCAQVISDLNKGGFTGFETSLSISPVSSTGLKGEVKLQNILIRHFFSSPQTNYPKENPRTTGCTKFPLASRQKQANRANTTFLPVNFGSNNRKFRLKMPENCNRLVTAL